MHKMEGVCERAGEKERNMRVLTHLEMDKQMMMSKGKRDRNVCLTFSVCWWVYACVPLCVHPSLVSECVCVLGRDKQSVCIGVIFVI